MLYFGSTEIQHCLNSDLNEQVFENKNEIKERKNVKAVTKRKIDEIEAESVEEKVQTKVHMTRIMTVSPDMEPFSVSDNTI